MVFKLHPGTSREASCWVSFLRRMGWARVTVVHSDDSAAFQFLDRLRHIANNKNMKSSSDRDIVRRAVPCSPSIFLSSLKHLTQ